MNYSKRILLYYLSIISYNLYNTIMQYPCFPKNNQSDIFDYCYKQNNPYSLTITKKPQILNKYIFKQSTYIWIVDGPQTLTEYDCQYIQNKCELKIDFVNTINDIIPKYSNNERKNIIICHQCFYLDGRIQTMLKPMLQKNRIFSIYIYGEQRINMDFKYKNRHFQSFEKVQQLIRFINESKRQNSSSQFVNFISLDNQKWDSNILVKTISAMINQDTNINLIMEKFKQFSILCFKQFTEDIEKFTNKYQNGQQPNESEIIKQYTKQSFMYRCINSLLRICKDPTCIYIIQPYFKNLFNAIRNIYQKKQKLKREKYICYRGGKISQKEVQMFKKNKGNLIQNLGFLSATKLLKVAKGFSNNAIFYIEVENSMREPQLDYGFADISQFSQQKKEEEILFNPLNSFQVIDFCIDPDYEEQNRYIIKLKYGVLAKVAAIEKNELTQKQKNIKSFAQHQIRSMSTDIGHVLTSANYNLEGCQQYANKFMEIAQKSEDQLNIAYAHNSKAIIAYNKGDKQAMEQQCTRSLKILEKLQVNGKKDIEKKVSTILNNLGTICNEIGQYYKSVECLQKSLQIIEKKNGKNHHQYVRTLNNLGTTLDRMGQSKKAAKYLQNGLQIQRETLGEDHPGYARTLNNLGITYDCMGQHKKAIEYLQKCLQIQKKTLGQDHPGYARTLNNLGTTYNKMGQPKKAMNYLQNSLQIQRKALGENHQEFTGTAIKLFNLYLEMCQVQATQSLADKYGGQKQKGEAKYLKKTLKTLENANQVQIVRISSDYKNLIKKTFMKNGCLQALEMTKHLLNMSRKMTNCHRGILFQQMEQQYRIYLSQASKQTQQMHKKAKYLEINGRYEQAQQQYTDILVKQGQIWKEIPQLMVVIESELQKLRQENQNKSISNFSSQDVTESGKQQQRCQGQSKVQINVQYDLKICKDFISQIRSKFTCESFEFQLYDQLVESIKTFDIKAAQTGLDIIIYEQNERLLQEASLDLRAILAKLNDLFMVMINIYIGQDYLSKQFSTISSELRDALKKPN